jgi:hypothetical protein
MIHPPILYPAMLCPIAPQIAAITSKSKKLMRVIFSSLHFALGAR